ncbi:hypothetical protein EWM64_g4652 [Hericium alpestre]|uniref:Uncharacterized protein n=1 Tax=Hericium alpestre TaxID=135208 RepID=A0A4Z0A0Q7_9AGAM|nr:hypothetical protein EWM64_g4652 [Hericium alpestre]
MLFAKKNNLKSWSAGSTTHVGGGKVVQSPVHKTGQPSTSGTQTNFAPTSIPPKAVESARPPKAPNHPKPPVASKTMAASKVLTMAQFPGTLRSVAAFKALNIANPSAAPKAPRLTKPPSGLKTLAASKLLDVSLSTGGPTAPPGLSPLSFSAPRTAAVEAVCRQISEQKEKTATVAACKANPESLLSAKDRRPVVTG